MLCKKKRCKGSFFDNCDERILPWYAIQEYYTLVEWYTAQKLRCSFKLRFIYNQLRLEFVNILRYIHMHFFVVLLDLYYRISIKLERFFLCYIYLNIPSSSGISVVSRTIWASFVTFSSDFKNSSVKVAENAIHCLPCGSFRCMYLLRNSQLHALLLTWW